MNSSQESPPTNTQDILRTPKAESLAIRMLDLTEKELQASQAIKTDFTENKIEHFTKPNPPQQELLTAWDDPDYKVFTYTGGNRSGKTTLGIILSLSVMFGMYPWSRVKLKFSHSKPRKIRIVGQDWESHIMKVVIPALKEWYPSRRKVTVKKNNVGAEALWTDELTGSTIEIMSNRQDSEVHEGWQGDLIYYDEPPKRDIRIANARGLVDRNGREIFCMTLLKEAWVDQDVIKARTPSGAPDPTVFNVHAEIYDNIGYGLTAEGVEQFASKLDDNEKAARLQGVPSYMAGLVYPEFKRQVHIKPRPKKPLPIDWVLDIAIDFHPSKEWAVLFLATDGRGFKYVIDEMWEFGSWKAIGEGIVKRVRNFGMRVSSIIIDPLAKGSSNTDLQEESVYHKMYDLFAGYGHSLSTACKDKESGIHLVNDLLMTENEMPALFFFSHLRRTILEIEGYMYDDNGKPKKDKDDMMENLYRLILLDTQYEPPEDEDEDDWEEDVQSSASSWTGY